MTEKQQRIYDHLKKAPEGLTPTDIGLALGQRYVTASSWVAGPLKKLVAMKLVEREKIGGRLKYKACAR